MGTLRADYHDRDDFDPEKYRRERIAWAKKASALADFLIASIDDVPDEIAELVQFDGYSLPPGVRPIARVTHPGLEIVDYKERFGAHWTRPKAPVITLEYRRSWSLIDADEVEKRTALAPVMSFFKVIFNDGEPEWTEKTYKTKAKPKTVYRGVGVYGGKRAIIELSAPWPPRDCEIETKIESVERSVLKCAQTAAA